jgi:putative FmdB family regulatory protein
VPIYDFRCLECGKVSEIFIRGSDQVACCSDCGSIKLERLVSSAYTVKAGNQSSGSTCCGLTERCETPPCSTGDICRRQLTG